MEERGGEYFHHFEKSGAYTCRRCRTVVARADSKIRKEGGFAAFATYTADNLTCQMQVGRRSTQFQVRCGKCNAFMGLLTKEATVTGDCLRVNSCAVVYVPTDAATVMPPDATFGADAAGAGAAGDGEDAEDDESDDGDDFDDELDRAFQ